MPSFFTSYVNTAISLDCPGMSPSNLTPDTMAEMRNDCTSFCKTNSNDLAFIDQSQAGKCFWIARNRPVPESDPSTRSYRLTESAKTFGPYTLTVRDGKIHGRQG